MTAPPVVAAALEYAARGWPVFPLQAAIRGVKESGKRPLTKHGVKDATTDARQIRAWWATWAEANVGIACGEELVVVDIDTATPPAPFDELPASLTVTTGRGMHVYLDPAGETFPNRANVRPGVDVRSAGGYVVAPPSVHYTGRVYQWGEGVELAGVPERWLAYMRRAKLERAPAPRLDFDGDAGDVMQRARAYLRAIPGAVSGQGGHAQTFTAAMAMVRGFALGEADGVALLASEYNPKCSPPWSPRELAHKVKSALADGTMPIGSLRNAERERAMPNNVVPISPPPEWGDVPPPDDEWMPNGVGPAAPTPFVAELLETNTRAAAHWRGRGKANGDTSARGYDIAVARDVFQAGGTDQDAESAVLSRADGHAAMMPPGYLADVLRRGRDSIVPTKEERAAAYASQKLAEAVDMVEAVTLYRTDPPTYELTVGGVRFDATAACIVNRGRMLTRIVEATNTIPELPKKRYEQWVAAVLARAVVVEMPEDASEAGGIMSEIAYMLEGMAVGEDGDALERGLAYVDDRGRSCIKLRPFSKQVKTSMPKLGQHTLCKMLVTLGWTTATIRIGSDPKQHRVWRKECEET